MNDKKRPARQRHGDGIARWAAQHAAAPEPSPDRAPRRDDNGRPRSYHAPFSALLRRWGGTLLHHLLPGACALCGGDSDDALCPGCAAQFFGPAAAIARCQICANPLGGHALPARHPADAERPSPPTTRPAGAAGVALLCGVCQAHLPAFDRTLVAADYAMPVDQLVLQLKFGHRLALAPLCARLLRDSVLSQPDFTLPVLLCPVPLGPRRLAERGYNQALEIARPLASSLGIALHAQLAVRLRETAAQSSVAPDRRQQNIAGAFAVPDAALVAGRHIGVVDDVMTSGRTLNELAATLKRHGAARVSNLVFARTPPH
jgi:ComF family protein